MTLVAPILTCISERVVFIINHLCGVIGEHGRTDRASVPLVNLIPARLDADLVQIGVLRQRPEAFCGELLPSVAQRIDDRFVSVQQPVTEMALPQVEPNSLNGIEFGAVGREIDKRHVVRDAQRFGDMPAGLIGDKGGMLIGRERCREHVKEHLHGLRRQLRQHECKALSGGGADGRKQMRPGIALITQAGRTLAASEPAMTHTALLSKSRLILEPERQALAGMLGGDPVEFGLEPPLAKASRAAGFAFGCEGRAFWRDRPSLRISLDMCPS